MRGVLITAVVQDRQILHRFTYFNTELVFCQVLIFLCWGGVFDCPRHGGGQAPALRWNRAVSFFFRWGGSKCYKNVTFCNIFSGVLCPCVGVVYLREDPCELGLFPSFGVSIFWCWGGVFEDCKNVIV